MDHPSPASIVEKAPLDHVERDEEVQVHDAEIAKRWVPAELQPWRAFAFSIFLVLLAAVIEGIWAANLKNGGWPTNGTPWTAGIYHLVITYIPNVIFMLVLTQLIKTDSAIMKLQPYVDLSQGNAPASKSLCLSYPDSKPYVALAALRNNHYLIASSAVAVIFAGTAFGFAASLFVVRSTLVRQPSYTTQATNNIGLDSDWTNLAPFLTAAGYAEAAALYGLSDPPFVKDDWVVGEVVLPRGQNGTLYASTTAIRVNAGCEPADVPALTPYANGTGYTLTGTWTGCSALFDIPSSSPIQFAAQPLLLSTCSSTSEIIAGGVPEPQFQPIVFFVYDATSTGGGAIGSGGGASSGNVNAAMAFCKPSMKIYYVDVQVDLVTRALLDVTITGDYKGDNDVTGGTLKGRPFNGIVFDSNQTKDPTVLARADAAKTGLPSAVYQTAHEGAGGVAAAFQGKAGPNNNQSFVDLFNRVYTRYQALSAKAVYFQEAKNTISVDVDLYQERIWVSTEAAQILSVSLVILAIALAYIQYRHMVNRRLLRMTSTPGTLASALAFTAGSDVGRHLSPRDDDAAIKDKLQDRMYAIDEPTGKLMAM